MNRPFVTMCLLAAATAAGAQTPTDKQAATRQVAAVAETWNRHDMRAFGRLFTADADFVNVAANWWKGTAIEKNHAFLHGTIASTDTMGVTGRVQNYGIFRTTTLTFDSIEVRFVTPTVALAHAAWNISGDARTAVVRKGLFLFVLQKTRRNWLIAAAQNTEANRPAELNK